MVRLMHFGRGIPPTAERPTPSPASGAHTPEGRNSNRRSMVANGIGRKSNRKAREENPQAAYDEATRRANGQCEARIAPDCNGRAEERHHIRLRSRGGKHLAENISVTCTPCHNYAHAHPEEAEAAGLMQHAEAVA